MPIIAVVTRLWNVAVEAMSRITDLAIRDAGGGAGSVLYATTRYDGAFSAWGIDGAGIRAIETQTYARLDATGGFGSAQNLGTVAAFPGDLVQVVTVALPGGGQMVYGGLEGAAGIGRLGFTAAGGFTGAAVIRDTAATHADRVAALATATLGGQTYLFSAGGADPGVTAWAVAASGALSAVSGLSPATGLWIAAPTALVTATAGGELPRAGGGGVGLAQRDSGGRGRAAWRDRPCA